MSGYATSTYRKEGVTDAGDIVFGSAPTFGAAPLCTLGNGTVSGTGVSVVEYGDGIHHKTVFTIAALSITMTDATTAGCHGTQKIYEFPEGRIMVYGAHVDLVITAGAGGISDTAAVVGALGTAAVGTNNATLTTSEADIVASIAATLTGGVGDMEGVNGTALVQIDGSAAAEDVNLNFAVPDADSSASDTLSVTGTIALYWIKLGDD